MLSISLYISSVGPVTKFGLPCAFLVIVIQFEKYMECKDNIVNNFFLQY